MINNKFKITLKGDDANNSLRLGDLIAQLDALKNVLNNIDRRISDRKSPGMYYRITQLPMKLAKLRVNPRPIGRGYKREPRSGSILV